jgi:protein TonB
MFEDSLLESGNRFKAGRRGATTVFSFVVQGLLLGILVLIPLIYTEALPQQQLMTFLVAPPPPPPPPPPPVAPVMQVIKKISSDMANGQLRTPTRIPEKVQMVKEEEPPPMVASAGGVAGGVVGGSAGGVLGGVLAAAAPTVAAAPKPVIPTRLKVSQGVMQANLIREIRPVYPMLAKQARISGTVILQAIISKDGLVENLTVKQGHPMLAPAAIEAVKQWRYKPTLLNGEPVEVEVVISVNFTLTGG